MNNKTEEVRNGRPFLKIKLNIWNIASWIFGILFCSIGLVNIFWGNDPGFGAFLVLLSLTYFPPVNVFLIKKFSFQIPAVLKIVLAIFIFWASLGVGELFDKINQMIEDINHNFLL